MNPLRCKQCLYWNSYNQKDGYCQRFPPSAHATRGWEVRGQTVWPRTEALDWCGEFAHKDRN